MSTETLNLSPQVYEYYRAHAQRESQILRELREFTATEFKSSAVMQISPEQGQFMHWLVKALNAKKILEIGTFTGYSALWMALALPQLGKLITCDIDPKSTATAQKFWLQAEVQAKIELKLGNASSSLQQLLDQKEIDFDFAFIDADKTGYSHYYELCLRLIRKGGVIAFDNTLMNGGVADPDNHTPNVLAMKQLNEKLLKDERILLSMLPISDGLTLAYKL